MTLQVPICGEVRLLNMMLNTGSANESAFLRLYTNSFDAGNTNFLSQLTVVASQYVNSGEGIPLTTALLTITSGAPSEASWTERIYTFVASLGNVHGYMVVHSAANLLLWNEKFTGGPYNIVNSGDQIKITPKFTLS